MRGSATASYRTRFNRCLAAAGLLIALLMQTLAPYLPMPEMGGMTSWDMALGPCPMHEAGSGHKAPAHPPQDSHCTVCTVIGQAGSTLAPADVTLACTLAYLQVERDQADVIQVAGLPAHAFSSRAPPHDA